MRVGTALLFVEMLIAAPGTAATFSEGRSAYDLNRITEAQRIYAAVIADTKASADDRAASERELARIAWLVEGNAEDALRHLEAARTIGDKPCVTAEMTARVLRESKRFREAASRSADLIASCPDQSEVDAIRSHLIGAQLDLAATNPPNRIQLLADAVAQTAKFTPDANTEAARIRLEAALLTNNATAALSAWKDYFWLDETDAPQALERTGATGIFSNGLRADASADDRLKLADLLVRTGFAEPSRRFAYTNALQRAAAGTPTWKRLDTYWPEREKLETTLLRINRDLAHGKSDQGATEAAAKGFTVALMQAAGASGDPREALLKYYGLVGTVGATNGYPSMHGGHVIEDHADSVTQYGKTARIHFIAIDNLLSNGFTSWLWDGSAQVGGWTADNVIVQIRPAYLQSPLRAIQQTRDGDARRTLIARGNQLSAEDIAKLKQRPVATLDGLNNRLQLQLVDRVATVARTKSSDVASFRRSFLAEFWRASLDQSIRKHEGRHAIDLSLGLKDADQAVLEYQAKLSELALADYPRMALRNMDRSLEGDGPHDRAAAKIFDQYRQWMEAHQDQIMGYDPAVPVLAQLDKLSDDQIREIARSLDPLANGKSSPTKL